MLAALAKVAAMGAAGLIPAWPAGEVEYDLAPAVMPPPGVVVARREFSATVAVPFVHTMDVTAVTFANGLEVKGLVLPSGQWSNWSCPNWSCALTLPPWHCLSLLVSQPFADVLLCRHCLSLSFSPPFADVLLRRHCLSLSLSPPFADVLLRRPRAPAGAPEAHRLPGRRHPVLRLGLGRQVAARPGQRDAGPGGQVAGRRARLRWDPAGRAGQTRRHRSSGSNSIAESSRGSTQARIGQSSVGRWLHAVQPSPRAAAVFLRLPPLTFQL